MDSGSLIISIFNDEKDQLIKYFYERESEQWHSLIHKNAGTLEENIQDTCNSIDEGSQIYVVHDKEKLVAFFSRFILNGEEALNGFHILKEYRNREFLIEFWGLVKSKFERSIYTGIYCKNEPAIKTLVKAGFVMNKLVLHDNKIFLILKFL